MTRRKRLLLGLGIAGPAILLVYILHEQSVEERLAIRPDGTLTADLELGSGISFNRGSLTITSHEEDTVEVAASIWGWGKYGVDIQAREHDGDVQVVGRVEGFLHWIFSGPTVDLRIAVPMGVGVEARIDGGPLVLEDLAGDVRAEAEPAGRNTITLRRSRGVVRLVAPGSDIDVEEVEGALKVESAEGGVRIAGVDGTAVIALQRHAHVHLERVRGNVHVAAEHGGIHLEDVTGDVDLEAEDGSVRIAGLDGRLRARTRHGDVGVEFRGDPAGAIETDAGAIDVEVPKAASFDLEAWASSGSIELDEGLDFERSETPNVAMGPLIRRDIATAAELGTQIAAEVHQKVAERVHRYLEQRRRGEDADDPWQEDWNWSWNDPGWRWHDHPWALREHRNDWGHRDDDDGDDDDRLAGTVNGGGETLQLQTRGGWIRIQD